MDEIPHACKHCQISIKVECVQPRPPFRLEFPQTFQQGQVAAEEGCLLFKEFISSYSGELEPQSSQPFRLLFIKSIYAPGAGKTAHLSSFVYLESGKATIERPFNAYTCPGNDASRLVPTVDTEVDSPSITRAISQWIQECRCIKNPPIESSFRPTRLLDTGKTNAQDYVTVIETEGIAVPKYVCLSYCWGASHPITNLISRKPSLGRWEIRINELPQTFKDTIHILHQLGFQYLWIDSLCIDQNDINDKEREIRRMSHAYKNAALTICASIARSCTEGFLQPRRDHSQFQLQISMPNDTAGTIYLHKSNWSSPPVEERLNTRAWVLQERLLSPRLLEYGWRTVRWSCFCDQKYSGYQPLSAEITQADGSIVALNYNLIGYLNPMGTRSLVQQRDGLFKWWIRVVEQYTRRNLTLAEDRLPAIGGITFDTQERLKVPYLAGLWNYEKLPLLLLWRVHSPLQKILPRPPTSRAPSWSWAAVDGPVSINQSEEQVPSVQVMYTSVSGGFGLAAQGLMAIKGPVRRGMWWDDGWDFTQPDLALGNTALTRQDPKIRIWPDCMSEIFGVDDGRIAVRSSLDVTYLAIGAANWDPNCIRGLLLAKTEEKRYKRLGYFQLFRDRDLLAVDDWPLEEVIIE